MTLRERLRAATNASPLIGTWVKLPGIETVELLAHAGMDVIAIDAEHAPIDAASAAPQIAMARALGVAPLVRCPASATHEVTRFIDAGAKGIVFPHIDDAQSARTAALQLGFEPNGTRGMGISSRAGDWGLHGTGAYLDPANRPLAIAMIESPAGVKAANKIVAVEGIDALLIGPADLAVALGCAGDVQHPDVAAAIRSVAEAAHSAGVPCGIAVGSPDDVKRFAHAGLTFYFISNDATLLGRAATSLVRAVRQK
jgi:2-keto-3-deoxy-L-rhamnonate aldolase RhmA